MGAYFARLFRSPQTGRIARLMAFTLLSALITTPLVQAWEVRYPLLGGLIGFLEAMYRVAVPTQPATPTEADSPSPPAQG